MSLPDDHIAVRQTGLATIHIGRVVPGRVYNWRRGRTLCDDGLNGGPIVLIETSDGPIDCDDCIDLVPGGFVADPLCGECGAGPQDHPLVFPCTPPGDH